jgi:hypothetical protein
MQQILKIKYLSIKRKFKEALIEFPLTYTFYSVDVLKMLMNYMLYNLINYTVLYMFL